MVVRDALMRDIERRAEECHPSLSELDFVIFSGDLAFRGIRSEYDTAEEDFLKPLLQAAGVGLDRLFMVPGNHDVDRSGREYLADLIAKFPENVRGSREKLSDAFADERIRRLLLFPMEAYATFATRFLGVHAPKEPDYGFCKTFQTKAGIQVALLGLNSAWMCGQFRDPYLNDVNDYGRLVLGEHQFRQYLAATASADVRIAFLHHPSHWLSDLEQRSGSERDLIDHCHFILRGHEHKSAVSVPVGTAGHCAIISAGAAYDRRDYPNGYNFTLVNLDLGYGTVYLRRYSDDRRQFIKDNDSTGDKSPGQVTFGLPKALALRPSIVVSAARPARKQIVGDPWSVQNPSTMHAMSRIYDQQHAQEPIVYKLIRFVVKANSLDNSKVADELTTVVEIQAAKGAAAIYCHKISLNSSKGSEYRGQASWSVRSKDGEPLEAIEIPIVDPEAPEYKQLLLFFDPVLQPNDNSYIVELKEFVDDSMNPLRTQGRDELFLRATRSAKVIEQIDLVLIWPASVGKIEMRKSRRRTVAPGQSMPRELLEGILKDIFGGEMPATFSAVGWTGSNLSSEGLFAVDLFKIS
jgi:hypothetical protein